VSERKPAVGRIVHYVSYGAPGGEYGSACRAAIVTGLPEETKEAGDCASLGVINPTGLFFNGHICADHGEPSELDDENLPELCGGRVYRPGTWHWPALS
jgi:hypothetical protein